MKRIVTALCLSALIPSAAQAAGTITKSGTAGATLIFPLSLVHIAGNALNFGTIVAGSGGTVTVSSTTGAGTVTGVSFFPGSTTSMDYFDVTGQTNMTMNITSTGGTVTAGASSMSFTTTPQPPAGYIAGVSGTLATAYFTVGGTLTVGAAQAPGNYTGTYQVTCTYQ